MTDGERYAQDCYWNIDSAFGMTWAAAHSLDDAIPHIKEHAPHLMGQVVHQARVLTLVQGLLMKSRDLQRQIYQELTDRD